MNFRLETTRKFEKDFRKLALKRNSSECGLKVEDRLDSIERELAKIRARCPDEALAWSS